MQCILVHAISMVVSAYSVCSVRLQVKVDKKRGGVSQAEARLNFFRKITLTSFFKKC